MKNIVLLVALGVFTTIAILILKYLKFRSSFVWSLFNLVAMLRYSLFTYGDLWTRIDRPLEPPPITMMQEQLSLN
jgi:hypothetical protein